MDALCTAASSVGFLENKKGPKRPPCTPPEFEWPQPSPAVRLGTTTIRSLVIILRIRPTELPKGCANHSGQTPDVKGRRRGMLDSQLSGVFRARRERIYGFQPCAGFPSIVMAGLVPAIHVFTEQRKQALDTR